MKELNEPHYKILHLQKSQKVLEAALTDQGIDCGQLNQYGSLSLIHDDRRTGSSLANLCGYHCFSLSQGGGATGLRLQPSSPK